MWAMILSSHSVSVEHHEHLTLQKWLRDGRGITLNIVFEAKGSFSARGLATGSRRAWISRAGVAAQAPPMGR
jgi:hypothetical protein